MSKSIKSLMDYPEIAFIGEYAENGQEKLLNNMISWFLEKREAVTGEVITLGAADDRRLMLQTAAYYIFHGYELLERAGKMNMLKYSMGRYLENLGALKKVYRHEAAPATVTLRYSIKETRESAVSIPAGAKVTAGDGVYFSTNQYSEIPPGELHIDVAATCSVSGSIGNIYRIGEINIMESRVPLVDAVSNITAAANGYDREKDEELRERIYFAPDAFSTAGAPDAYLYHARSFDPSVEDIYISSPSAGVVELKVLTEGGLLPEPEYLIKMQGYLSQKHIKPQTDEVRVVRPDISTFNVDVKFYIGKSDFSKAETIRRRVEKAIDAYIRWQQSAIGRDVNPDELIRMVKNAGAKRISVTAPVYNVVGAGASARLQSKTISYGGIEDD